MKTIESFYSYIRNLNEYKIASFENQERFDYKLEQIKEDCAAGMAGEDIEKLFKASYVIGGKMFADYYKLPNFLRVVDSIYGEGACKKRNEQREKEREEEYAAKEKIKLEQEIDFQLNEPCLFRNEKMTVRGLIDYLLTNSWIPSKFGHGPGAYWIFKKENEILKLQQPVFRRKHVNNYILNHGSKAN